MSINAKRKGQALKSSLARGAVDFVELTPSVTGNRRNKKMLKVLLPIFTKRYHLGKLFVCPFVLLMKREHFVILLTSRNQNMPSKIQGDISFFTRAHGPFNPHL